MYSIDLNCDIGEGFCSSAADMQKDETLMQYVSSINVACGYHAGDACVMHRVVDLAIEKNIAIGAHPSFPDREDFGREVMELPDAELYDHMVYQLGALEVFLRIAGAKLHHIKPHGALYNLAASDVRTATVLCRAFKDFDPLLIIYGLAGSEMIRVAGEAGLATASEAFADRTYQSDGSLTSRKKKDALIEDPEIAAKQVLGIIQNGEVLSTDGKVVMVKADTVCVHGDGNHAILFAHRIQKLLVEEHIRIEPITKRTV